MKACQHEFTDGLARVNRGVFGVRANGADRYRHINFPGFPSLKGDLLLNMVGIPVFYSMLLLNFPSFLGRTQLSTEQPSAIS